MTEHLITHIFEHLNANTTVITPNRRLSATLHKQYQAYQIERQQACWPTPTILPAISWIQGVWQNESSEHFTATPLLLNAAQEQYVWESIVLRTKNSDQLLQVSETAEMAKSAWGLLKQWQVDMHSPIFTQAEDYAALHAWATQFQAFCQAGQWIDMASVPDLVTAKIKNGEITPPAHLILFGFTELSPQLAQLLASCEAAGSKISQPSLATHAQAQCQRLSLLDAENEIVTLARWAKATWEKNPQASIGCVIPALEKIRDRVQQIFSAEFAAKNTYTVDKQTAAFNLSAGKSLLQYPLIHTALVLLGLHKHTIAIDTFSYVLASPFLGEAEKEHIKRCLFDSQLKNENVNNLHLPALLETQTDARALSLHQSCPLLAKRVKQFLTLLDDYQTPRSYSEWTAAFTHLLTALGWPGERSLNSEEYQMVDSWFKLLADFSTLDQISTPLHFQQALQTLHKMAAKTIFQPKTPDAPIQVLGVLEAAALPFDHVWIAGMDDISWPPQPKPHPFIPKQLQRELHMPHATAERELRFCNLLIQQFKQSAGQVIFSHAEKNEELELQASPLIRDVPDITLSALHLPPSQTLVERIYQTKQSEAVLDDNAPALGAQEKIRGGVNVIKQQALCPFKAFAEWRLHAHELESPLPGLRAKDRGNLIHKALELLWNTLQDHANLQAMDETALHTLVAHCIDQALTTVPNSRRDYTQYLALEKQRLHKLIGEWLAIEKERGPFKVMTQEKAAQIRLNQLTLSVRIDRIDELPDGRKLIIDYKTGKHNEVNSWFSDRPDEPQLPLYSLLDTDNTIGITFAQVASGESGFKGVSRYALDIKGIKLLTDIRKATAVSWEEQQTEWRTTLTQLSDDFSRGAAQVSPKDPVQTCAWCALKPLCRINEKSDNRHDH